MIDIATLIGCISTFFYTAKNKGYNKFLWAAIGACSFIVPLFLLQHYLNYKFMAVGIGFFVALLVYQILAQLKNKNITQEEIDEFNNL